MLWNLSNTTLRQKNIWQEMIKYYHILSEASKVSLTLQGGIMDDKEAKEFENNEFFENSIKLRKFDENAKKAGLKIKSINQYKNLLVV